MDSVDLNNEQECRVCRCNAEESRPLYTPCLCSGSIGLVHQDCLEAWLAHSKKHTCELCNSKYHFAPEYAENTPTTLPLNILLKSTFKLLLYTIIPFVARVISALLVWLVFVPVSTTAIYCMCISREVSILKLDENWLGDMSSNITHGIVLIVVIGISLLMIMSFTDFLRVHWLPAAQPPVVGQNNAVAPVRRNPRGNNARDGMRRRRFGDRLRVNRDGQEGQANPQADEQQAAAPIPAVPIQPENNFEHIDIHNQNATRDDRIPTEAQQGVGNGVEWDLRDFHRPLDEPEPRMANEDTHNINPRRNVVADNLEVQVGDDEEEEDQMRDQNEPVVPHQQHLEPQPVPLPIPAEIPEMPPVADAPAANLPNANANVNADDNLGALGMEDVQEVGIEIRVALFELLGVQGAFHVMYRNALWLQAFTSLYMVLMVMFPSVLGKMAVKLVSGKLQLLFQLLAPLGQQQSSLNIKPLTLLELVGEKSAKLNLPLQFTDFLYISCGFVSLCCVVGVLFLISVMVEKFHITSRLFRSFSSITRSLAVVTKVGILLVMRILVLPIFLGCVVLGIFSHTIIPYSLDAWAQFLTVNALGAYALCWASGITFMLTMTISILQLREVLHPDFCAKMIRPQEGHADLIRSLVDDNALVHCRRVLMSTLVYMVLMMLFLFTPLKLYSIIGKLVVSDAAVMTKMFEVSHWYYIPQIQLPMELIISHIVFLTLLEKRKDIIGQLQHRWLVTVCRYLGLTRYVLPSPLIKKEKISGAQPADETALVEHVNETSLVLAGESRPLPKEVDEVGPPLVRPPPGWDVRLANVSSRWAWTDETPSDVEKNVAPRVPPSHCLLRCILLALLSWTLVNAITLFVLIVPLNTGRIMFSIVQIPQSITHDPICFLLGSLTCAYVMSLAAQCSKLDISRHLASLKHLTLAFTLKVVKLIVMWILSELSVGAIVSFNLSLLYQLSAASSAALPSEEEILMIQSVDLIWLLQTWIKGAFVVEMLLAVLFSQSLGPPIIAALGLEEWLAHWRVAVLRVVSEIQQSWQLRDTVTEWTLQSLPLDDIEQLLVGPLFSHMFLRGGLPLCVISLIFGIDSDNVMLFSTAVVTRNLRNTSFLLFISWTAWFLVMPVKAIASTVYRKIRDDNYLVGRKLQNNVQRQQQQHHHQTGTGPAEIRT